MAKAPHDISDLHLAPVLLTLDARLDELGMLDLHALTLRVALESDRADYDVEMRVAGVLDSVRHLLDCHGWALAWDPRGIRVAHGAHSVVLGVPDVVAEFVAGSATPADGSRREHAVDSSKTILDMAHPIRSSIPL